MHIPDGFISGPINTLGAAAAIAAVGVSAAKASAEVRANPQRMPLLATTGAFVFAAQMLNFPIGGGTSGHFMGGALVAALLGPWSAILAMSLVLTIQCLGFADGGLTALGTNIFNMGLIGGLGAYLVMRVLRPILPAGSGGFIATAGIASWVSIVLAALACSLELAFSGTSPLELVLPAMLSAHAVIGIGEALITAAVISAVLSARPDIFAAWAKLNGGEPTESYRTGALSLALGGLILALLLGVFLSPFASAFPDGLEKVAEVKGFLSASDGSQSWTASPLPDYSTPGVGAEGLSTSLAGLIGTLAVFLTGFIAIKLAGRLRRERA